MILGSAMWSLGEIQFAFTKVITTQIVSNLIYYMWKYISFNAVFGKIGRIASYEVFLQLIKSKCFPVLYYGVEACHLRKSQYNSINYVINSTFRKIFNTRSQEVVDICLEMFNCLPAEKAVAIRKRNFLNKFCVTNNELCTVFTDHAKKELATLLADI